jgi:hypothetical protein
MGRGGEDTIRRVFFRYDLMKRYFVWIDKRLTDGTVIGAGLELPEGLSSVDKDKLCFKLINTILRKEISVGWRELAEDEVWPADLSDKYGVKKHET